MCSMPCRPGAGPRDLNMARIILAFCLLATVHSFRIPSQPAIHFTGTVRQSRTASLRYSCQLQISQIQKVDRKVKAVVTDVDGTLFNSNHRLGPSTRDAVIDAMKLGIPVVMATGKSRGPWVKDLRESLGLKTNGWNLNGPSVFIQGLMVCDSEDKIVFSRLLSQEMVREMDTFAADRRITVIAYTTDDRIVARQVDQP